jgi:hypothetical protein
MDKKGENFSLLFFVSGSLKREDGSRIATPHSLIKERFTRYGVRASVVAVSNECFVARVSDAVLCSVQNFGETLRVSERLPKAGDCIYVIVKVGSGDCRRNGTSRNLSSRSTSPRC